MASKRPEHSTGAPLPSNQAWKKGKTAASIRFVKDLEAVLERPGGHNQTTLREVLGRLGDLVKEGHIQINTFIDLDLFVRPVGERFGSDY